MIRSGPTERIDDVEKRTRAVLRLRGPEKYLPCVDWIADDTCHRCRQVDIVAERFKASFNFDEVWSTVLYIASGALYQVPGTGIK